MEFWQLVLDAASAEVTFFPEYFEVLMGWVSSSAGIFTAMISLFPQRWHASRYSYRYGVIVMVPACPALLHCMDE